MKTLSIILLVLASMSMNHMNKLQNAQIKELEQRVNLLQEAIQIMQDELNKPVEPELQTWTGKASYYSVAGCVGCRSDMLMANGDRFDEGAMTLAFNRLPLGSMVRVTNPLTGLSQIAEVTDTGGFEALGRIADLSLGLKDVLNCTDLCSVRIERIK